MNFLSAIKTLITYNVAIDPEIKQEEKPIVYGSHGRLEIPTLNISIPLYEASGSTSQKVVDDQDSAAFIRYGTQNIIADHVSQANFSNLIKSRPGKTVANITYEDGTSEKYLCMVSQIGHIKPGENNKNNHMFDWRWTPIRGKNPGGLTIYTCMGYAHDGIQDVTITYWLPFEEANKVQLV